MAEKHHPQVARYRPGVDSEPTMQSYQDAAARGLGDPRRARLRQGPRGRNAVVPVVVPDGHLRQLRHDGQRRAPAQLCHVPHRLRTRSDPGRAAEQLPGGPRSRGRHRRLHGQALDRQAVGDPRGRQARREASICRRRASWRSTSSTACASTACCATGPARCTAWTRTSSGRRRSRSPSATTSTRGTRVRRRMRRTHLTGGVWACTFVGECSAACRRASIRPARSSATS